MNYSDPVKAKSVAIADHALHGLAHAHVRRPKNAISHQTVAAAAMALDAVAVFGAGLFSTALYHAAAGIYGDAEQVAGLAVIVAALFIGLAKHSELYTVRELLNLKSQIIQVIAKWFIVFLFMTAVGFALKTGAEFSRGVTIAFAVSGLISLIALRAFWRIVVQRALTSHRLFGRKAYLIAESIGSAEEDLVETLSRHGIEVVKYSILPWRTKSDEKNEIVKEAVAALRGSDIEEVIVGANVAHWPQLNELLAQFRILPLPVNFVPVGTSSELLKRSSHTIGDTITIELQRSVRTRVELATKRFIDVLIATTALILLLPLFVMTAIAIKLDSSGPVLFRQKRCGFNGRQFSIFKFRSMSVLEDGPKIVAAQRDDNRVTRIGGWLRRTSIDELPQLFNVLQGTMSIVGPRPHALAHDTEFDRLVSKYALRQHVKPGLTGWAQVHGLRGQLRTIADIKQRIEFDLWYIDNWSLGLDFKILLMTIIELARGENAY